MKGMKEWGCLVVGRGDGSEGEREEGEGGEEGGGGGVGMEGEWGGGDLYGKKVGGKNRMN